MPKLSRFQVMQHVKNRIVQQLKEEKTNVFTYKHLSNILWTYRYEWTLPAVTTVRDFIEFLIQQKILTKIKIDMPTAKTERFVTDKASPYEIALTLQQGSYLSHYTALFLHGLTINVPKDIFINKEQGRKAGWGADNRHELEQKSIDWAFARPMRKTKQIARFKLGETPYKVWMLNGKNVEREGVINLQISDNGPELPVTDVERTLIDVTVRPDYAGGVYEVANAYKFAVDHNRLSVNRLLAMLKRMDYVYPYHQAIGFYLEQAGAKENRLKLVEKLEMNYDFYLTYQMKEKKYIERWRLYIPQGFEENIAPKK